MQPICKQSLALEHTLSRKSDFLPVWTVGIGSVQLITQHTMHINCICQFDFFQMHSCTSYSKETTKIISACDIFQFTFASTLFPTRKRFYLSINFFLLCPKPPHYIISVCCDNRSLIAIIFTAPIFVVGVGEWKNTRKAFEVIRNWNHFLKL